jgi:hypothetical protein
MKRARSIHRRYRECIQGSCGENQKERDHKKDLAVNLKDIT